MVENRAYNLWFLDNNAKWIAPDLGQITVKYWARRWFWWYVRSENAHILLL